MAKPVVLLIVDDEEEIRENLRDFAEFKGFKVLEAANGVEALKVLDQHRPELILSDLMMPEMGGLQLLKELSKRNNDIPVVIMTAFGTMEYAIDAMKNGASDFITKPIDLEYLIKVINRILERSAMERKIREQQRQLEEDLNHASTIQRCLLPNCFENEKMSFYYRYEPLIAIGGDYLTVHHASNDHLAIALYDVSGHGVSAALTANLVHTQLQQLLSQDRPTSNIIDLLNRFITQNIERTGMFITLVVGVFDLYKGTVTFSNAGHPDIVVMNMLHDRFETIPSHTTPIGIRPEILSAINETTVELKPGDRFTIYTDGFVESRNKDGKMVGFAGLKQLMLKHSKLTPKDFIDNLFNDLTTFHSGEPEDDLTLVVVDIK